MACGYSRGVRLSLYVLCMELSLELGLQFGTAEPGELGFLVTLVEGP